MQKSKKTVIQREPFARDNILNEEWSKYAGEDLAIDSDEFKQFVEFLVDLKIYYKDGAGKILQFDTQWWILIYKESAKKR